MRQLGASPLYPGMGLAAEHTGVNVEVRRVTSDEDLEGLARSTWSHRVLLVLVPRELSCDNALRALRVAELGAAAIVPDDIEGPQLAALAAELAQRGSVGDPFTSELLIRGLRGRAETRAQYALTTRERDVLRLLVDGHTCGDIAQALAIATATVQTHLKNLYRKLDVSSKASATAIALRHHLL